MTLPRGRGALPPEVVAESQRRRLLTAMAEVAGSKGIVELTIADLIAHAGVGRKSFYALFSDKTDCYLQAFRLNADVLVSASATRMQEVEDPVEGLREGLRAYLQTLQARPLYARAFLFESMRAGAEAMAERERTFRKFEKLFTKQHEKIRAGRRKLSPVPEAMVVAMVAGITELVFRELERRGKPDLVGLEPDVLRVADLLLGL